MRWRPHLTGGVTAPAVSLTWGPGRSHVCTCVCVCATALWLHILERLLRCLHSLSSSPFILIPSPLMGSPGDSDGKEFACNVQDPDSIPGSGRSILGIMCVHAKLLQSCLTLCDCMDYSLSDSSVHEILQARILECVAMSSSSGSPQRGD